jgi:peptide/nickel transport system substrate-binding protein
LSISREKLQAVKEWGNYNIENTVLPFRVITLFYNTKEEPLKKKDFRQALTYAINKEEVVKNSTGNKGKLAHNSYAALEPLQAGTKEKYTFNLEKANQLLAGEGWVLQDGKRMKDGKPLSLTITTLADHDFEDSARKIKASWEKLGIEVTIAAVSGSELRDQIVPNRTYNILLSSLLLNSDLDQYVIWHTTQASEGNVSGISSPKLDKLLEDARRTLDPKLRTEKYQEFSRHLLDESPAAFLYYPNYTWIYSNRVEKLNFAEFQEPVDRFRSAHEWILKRPII